MTEKIFYSIVDKAAAQHAWSQVNFGENATLIGVVMRETLQIGLGYFIGSQATFLLEECGLMKENIVSRNLTRKGEKLLRAAFKNL